MKRREVGNPGERENGADGEGSRDSQRTLGSNAVPRREPEREVRARGVTGGHHAPEIERILSRQGPEVVGGAFEPVADEMSQGGVPAGSEPEAEFEPGRPTLDLDGDGR